MTLTPDFLTPDFLTPDFLTPDPLTPDSLTPDSLTLDIVSDTICPWCWVGKRNLEAALPLLAAENLHVAIQWRPFQLNPDMPPAGVDRRTYRTQKFGSWERSQQLDRQLAETGARAGLEFRHDRMQRTPNTIASHILVALAHEQGGAPMQDRVVEALFAAYFNQGEDVGDQATLTRIATACGLDPAQTTAALTDPARAATIAQEDRGARAQGLSGVPSFILAGHPLFSGAHPPETMAKALRAAITQLTP